jgi:hypothetical protein
METREQKHHQAWLSEMPHLLNNHKVGRLKERKQLHPQQQQQQP